MWQKIKVFLFENRTPGQTVAKNTFWLGLSGIGGRFLRALVVIYAARILGAASWGVFSYAITLIAFLTILADFGINSLLTREASKNQDIGFQNHFLSTAFFLKSGFSILSMAIIVLLVRPFVTLQEAVPLLPIVALVLLFDNFREFGFSLIRVTERMEREAALFLATNLFILFFGILFLRLSPTVESFTWAYTAGAGLGMLLTFAAVWSHLGRILSDFDRKLVRPILSAAWPFALSGILGGLMVNTDILVIGWLKPAADVGYYSAAQRIILLLYIIPGVLATSIFPLLSRLAHAQDFARSRKIIESALRSVFMVALPIAVGGILVAEPLIKLLFGAEYLPGTTSLQILLLTVPLNFAAIILSNLVFAYEGQKKLVLYAGIGGALNVFLDLLLIPAWGIAGSAFATLIVQLVSLTYLWSVATRIHPFRVLGQLGRMAFATGLIALGLVFGLALGLKIAFAVPLAALLYFLLLFAMREPLLQDFLWILGIAQD